MAGHRILVHTEQGYGDAIQFIRYTTLLAERGAEVIVECEEKLVRLFCSLKSVRHVARKGDPLPPFDLHVPVLSQPLAFGTRSDCIPSGVPYLFAEADRCEEWRGLISSSTSRLKVGIAWMGNREDPMLHKRHIPSEMLGPLLTLNNVDFHSVQVASGAVPTGDFAGHAHIKDSTKYIEDFADTAGLVAELDLIISVDTATAHLAGALGKHTWTLLPFVPDWRWGLERKDTPWYPTMRLFRQPALGDWASVIKDVRLALEHTVAEHLETTT